MAHLSAKKAGIYSLLCAQEERGIGFGECIVFFAIFYKIALKFVQVKWVHAQLCPILCDPTMLLSPWNFSGKNTGVGCHFLLHGIFPIQRLNPHLLHLLNWQADSLSLCHLGSLYTG